MGGEEALEVVLHLADSSPSEISGTCGSLTSSPRRVASSSSVGVFHVPLPWVLEGRPQLCLHC